MAKILYHMDFGWSKKYDLNRKAVGRTLGAISSKLKTEEVIIGLYERNEYYICYYFECGTENCIHELLKIMDDFVDEVSKKMPDIALLGIWHLD